MSFLSMYMDDLPNKRDMINCGERLLVHLNDYQPCFADMEKLHEAMEMLKQADADWFGEQFSPFPAKSMDELRAKLAIRYVWCIANLADNSETVVRQEEAALIKENTCLLCEELLPEDEIPDGVTLLIILDARNCRVVPQ